jgi:hypothetical protein
VDPLFYFLLPNSRPPTSDFRPLTSAIRRLYFSPLFSFVRRHSEAVVLRPSFFILCSLLCADIVQQLEQIGDNDIRGKAFAYWMVFP